MVCGCMRNVSDSFWCERNDDEEELDFRTGFHVLYIPLILLPR
jgi:hypothetical protein